VTIAIGFAYDGGLLFCADTKVTGMIKANESKLEHFRSENGEWSITFAMSSEDLNFPRMAISRCWNYVNQMDFASASIDAVHDSAEFSLAEFYREHIFPHPDRTPKAVFLELLVGIWLRGEKRLYKSHETVLTAIDQYECIGSGAYLAKYLIGQYQIANPGRMSLQDAAMIIPYAVQSAIDYDENCGGNPETMIILDNGEVERNRGSLPDTKFINGLSEITWKLLHDLVNMNEKDKWGSPANDRMDKLSKQVRELDTHTKWSGF
jgi:20S proteasome alpha/beta subunit